MSMYGSQPGWTEFTFINYPTRPNYVRPQLFVYPVDSFPTSDRPYRGELAAIQAFLAARAAVEPPRGRRDRSRSQPCR